MKSGPFLAGYVVDGSTEKEVAANMKVVAEWYAERAIWRRPSTLVPVGGAA